MAVARAELAATSLRLGCARDMASETGRLQSLLARRDRQLLAVSR
jgi:hypothetical protein